jgi:hypothetical protein
MATAIYSDLNGVTVDEFSIDDATLDASGLTAARTFTLPDASGTVALTSDIAGGSLFIDGGAPDSVYTVEQTLDGGGP